jgi:hypothetical protein
MFMSVNTNQKFFMDTYDGDHYIIPVDRAAEWNEWLEIPDDDERSWQVPDFVYAIGGCPTQVQFTLAPEDYKKWIVDDDTPCDDKG